MAVKFSKAKTLASDPPKSITLMDAVLHNSVNQFTADRPCRAISFAVQGAVKVTTVDLEDVVIASGMLNTGMQHSMQILRIWSTGTTATGIVAYK